MSTGSEHTPKFQLSVNYYHDPAHCVRCMQHGLCCMVSGLTGLCSSLWSPCMVSAGLLCLPGLCWSLQSNWQGILTRHGSDQGIEEIDSRLSLAVKSWLPEVAPIGSVQAYACLLHFAEKMCYRSALVVLCIRSSVQCSWVFRRITKVWRQTWCLLIRSFRHLPYQSKTTTHIWFSCHTV